jgi:chromosome segregation ATPase
LNAKNAEISALMAQLNQLKNSQRDLENKFAGSQAEISSKTERIIELEKALNGKGGAPVGADPAELKKVTKERDERRRKL